MKRFAILMMVALASLMLLSCRKDSPIFSPVGKVWVSDNNHEAYDLATKKGVIYFFNITSVAEKIAAGEEVSTSEANGWSEYTIEHDAISKKYSIVAESGATLVFDMESLNEAYLKLLKTDSGEQIGNIIHVRSVKANIKYEKPLDL